MFLVILGYYEVLNTKKEKSFLSKNFILSFLSEQSTHKNIYFLKLQITMLKRHRFHP